MDHKVGLRQSLEWRLAALILTSLIWLSAINVVNANNISYDGRSLIINGQHLLLFSGSIHYPRSTPQDWPYLIAKAKEGGIDVIQTYVFWNLHEPQQGKYDFSGNANIVRFIKTIQAQGLYVCLRIGPFIQSEWSYGGLPYWLHDVPGIVFRSDNEPFKFHMQRFTTKIVNLMKNERLFATQGGPIILSQIENEYKMVEAAFHDKGPPYVRWAAEMAVGLQTGVPWIMCKQDDAPDPVINTCNGMRCGETFTGPNSPKKPSIWTENWTSFYQVYGEEPLIRSAEEIAFHVALFIAKKGSYVNYYMYHGGTNFGRSASSYVITSYYDQAPLDEYGLKRQPTWGHLKDLHTSIKLCSKHLLYGTQTTFPLSQFQQAYVYKVKSSGECAAFLVNKDMRDVKVLFRNFSYDLPQNSISILPDCRTVAFNTGKVSTQYNTRTMVTNQSLTSDAKWQQFKEAIPNFDNTSLKPNMLLDQISTAKDTSDYLWYTFRYQHDSTNSQQVLNVLSRAHALHVFVNGVFIGFAHGSHQSATFSFESSITLSKGVNYISLLSVMVGLSDSGAFLEKKVAGLRRVRINGKDLTQSRYQIGLLGEKLQVYTSYGSSKIQWSTLQSFTKQRLTWYKTIFDAPNGTDPIALNFGSMGKGEAWVNGRSIGRYWVSFLTSNGKPSQTWYNVPRSFLKPTGNLLVILEEETGNPLGISIDRVKISKVCGKVTQSYYPPIGLWENQKKKGRRAAVQLRCTTGRIISNILFASFGTPSGDCQTYYSLGACHSSKSKQVVEQACMGKTKCSISLSNLKFGGDPCPGIIKTLLVDAQCT